MMNNMYASQLLANLRLLTLAGINNGELEWMGTTIQWKNAYLEGYAITSAYKVYPRKVEISRPIEIDWQALENLVKDYKLNYKNG